ncbi:MAG: hypothetical protein A2049_07610 [Elusimicrobia bacterium GWA2_62_23]|nr:MAG: hypothetical protein A2049_07610 [Elusimicrobia bacterium GWA2_62_23]
MAGARIKFGEVAPASNEEGVFYPAAEGSLAYSSTETAAGINTLWLWLEDNVGNADYAMASSVELRYDGGAPVSTAAALAYSGAGIVLVSFGASDSVSGIASTALWWRQAGADWSSGAYVLAGSSGTFSFDTHGVQGNWEFYTRACDNAGNCESVPVSTTSAKVGSYVDVTPPVISNVRVTEITYDTARVSWETDDAASAVLEYSFPGAPVSKLYAPAYSNSQSLLLGGLVYPANYSFTITATNKAGLSAGNPGGAFYVPPKMTTNVSDLGVLNTGLPIIIGVTNPYVSSITYTLNGQTITQAVSPNMPLEIYVSGGQGQTSLSLNLDGFTYSTSFVVDTATRTVFLARFAALDGGLDAAQGNSAALAAAGQALTAEAANINGRAHFGYFAGIDPVAPGNITDLVVVSGPGADQATLTWSAPGDDAYAGTAMKYDIRWATTPISAGNFSAASRAAEAPFPAAAGTSQTSVLSGLGQLATYYFAIKTEDELGNLSGLSNDAAVLKGYVLAGTVTVNGVSEISFIAPVQPSISLISTVSATGAVAVGSAAAGGLTLAGNLYEIGPEGTFEPPAMLTFHYSTAALTEVGLLESDIAIYEHFPEEGWVKLPGQVVDTAARKITVPVGRIASLFGIFGVVKDRTAPASGISYVGPVYRTEERLFISAVSSVVLSAYDPVVFGTATGVAFTEYRVDAGPGAAFIVYSEPFGLPAGERRVEFRSWDGAGNLEEAKVVEVYVDASAPVTAALVAGATGQNGWYVSVATVSLVATDTLSGVAEIYYGIDPSTEPVNYFAPVVLSSEGIAGLFYYAADNVRNYEAPRSTQVKVDLAGPAVMVESSPAANAAGWNNSDVSVVFSGTDAVSGVAWCSSATTVGVEGEGLLVSGVCLDLAGNSSTAALTLNIDKTAPAINISSPAAGVFVATKDKVTVFYAVKDNLDPAPVVEARLVQAEDRGSPRGARLSTVAVENGGLFEPLDLDDGLWRLVVKAQDRAGNLSEEEGPVFEVVHDVFVPRTSLAVTGARYESGGTEYVTKDSGLKLESVDDLVEAGDGIGLGVLRQSVGLSSAPAMVFESTSARQGELFASTFTAARAGVQADGHYSLEYGAEDVLGNREALKTWHFAVDGTAPESSLAFTGNQYFGDSQFVSAGTEIRISAQDPVVNGVAAGALLTKYLLDGGEWRIYAGSFTVALEGRHTLDYYSLDRLLNAEGASSLLLAVDNTPPAAYLSFGEPKVELLGLPVLTPESKITLSAADPVSVEVASGLNSVFYEIENVQTGALSPVAAYAAPFAVAGQGTFVIRYWAKDNVGNAGVPLEKMFSVSTWRQDGLAASGRFEMSGNSDIAGAVKSNDSVLVSGNARILGDVVAATVTVSGKAQITGMKTSGAMPLAMEPISVSRLAQAAAAENNNAALAQYLTEGSLTLSSQASLVLSTGTYYLRGLELTGGSSITVAGRVDIVVEGSVTISGGSSLNAAGQASLLSLIVSTSSELKFSGGADIAACVYAPYSDLKLAGNAVMGGHYFVRTAAVSGNGNIIQSGETLPIVAPAAGGGKTKVFAVAEAGFGVLAGPSSEFRLGEVYVYPDPAKGGEMPAFHIECGIADSVKITIYTVSGRQAHEAALGGLPAALDDGNGLSYAYEYIWRGHIPSGVYLYAIEAQKSGKKLKKTGKFAVVR